jgi:phosphoribosylglycinamide formyltransferase 2
VTDGVTEGQHEPGGQPAAAEDDNTTVIVVPPHAAEPHADEPPADADVGADADARPRVMLLGSGESSRELAVALRHLGAQVIAVDDYANAPAHRVADQSLILSMTDPDGLSDAIARLQPDFVVTATDKLSGPARGALERLTAAEPDDQFTELVPNARAVRLTGDRESLRRLAADQLGLPTAPFWFVASVAELKAVAAHSGFPLLVRPVSGRGHSVVSGPDDVEAAWQRAVANGTGEQRPRVMAETIVEIEFDVTLIVVRSEGPEGPLIEFCSPIGYRSADGVVVESWQPQQMSAAAVDAAKSIAARIVKALGGRGVFGVELMINGDEVYFADVTARLHQSAWVTLRSQRLSAFELQARAILGLPLDTMMMSPGAAHVVDAGRDGGALTAAALTAALAVPETDLRVFAPRSGSPDATTRLGVALATAPDVPTARDRARQVTSALNVRDSRG